MTTTMSKVEIAELFGVSTRTITNWQTLGWLVRSGRGDAGPPGAGWGCGSRT
jgi:phage terminase Nu1 subunit (DNA packaging protein)